MNKVIIIGGGIAGLSAAYELTRNGVPFVLLERSSRLGGVILNEEIDGFTIDAGPDALLLQKPEGVRLCEEVGLGNRLVATKPPRLAYIQRNGRLHALPAASVLGIPTRVGPFVRSDLFSWRGKLRMGAEIFIPARRDNADESIGGFITRRFGREATVYLAEPLLAGIHAGDVDRLSLQSLFPRFAEAERKHGSLLRAFRAQAASNLRRSVRDTRDTSASSVSTRPESTVEQHGAGASGVGVWPRTSKERPRSPFMSLPGGLSELSRAVAAALPHDSVVLDAAAACVRQTADGYRVETRHDAYEGRALILATPAFATARVAHDLDPQLSALCDEVPYASIATVALAFRRSAINHPLNGSGYVVPRVEGSGILAASWLSSKWPHRAPDDAALLRTFIGGARDPRALEESDAELVKRSLAAIGAILSVRGEPLFTRVYRFERANAQHEVGHLARLARIDALLTKHPGLFVTGSGFRGVGIPDCVADGRATARAASEYLSKGASTEGTEEQRRSRS